MIASRLLLWTACLLVDLAARMATPPARLGPLDVPEVDALSLVAARVERASFAIRGAAQAKSEQLRGL